MDRNLPGNHKFWLNEDSSSNNDGKMHIFVKLTDSCMKTIEAYIKTNKKLNANTKPTIKFNLNGGEISIPTTSSERKAYSFNISPEDKTPEVFQCIKQINRDQLESCAPIEQRLNIHAQEDVYSMTKTKVTEFQKNEEQNKKQTKDIGESSKTILQKKTNKSSNQRASTVSSAGSSTTTKTASNQKQGRSTINVEQHLSPTNNQLLSSERPIRERLVHILAARPYKKPELILRLKKDGGIRDDEKDQLNTILPLISTESKIGELNILTNILTSGEVSSDWPFFAKAEASCVQKKIKEHQTNSNRSTINKTTNDNSSGISNRLSTINTSSITKSSMGTSVSGTKTKLNSTTARSIVTASNEKKSSIDNQEISTTTNNQLNDERIQQLSDMLDKISSALSQSESLNDKFIDDNEISNQYDIDQAEQEYNRLVIEYNSLIDYLKSISEKFSLLEQQFNEEKTNEKASKIIEEFFKCENSDGFINKRQRLIELHIKLINLKKFLEKTSPSNSFHISDEDDDHYDD